MSFVEGAAPQGWVTHLQQAMVPIQGWIQLRPQTGGSLAAFGVGSQSSPGCNADTESGVQPAPSVSVFSCDPLCKNTCRYCRYRPCDVGWRRGVVHPMHLPTMCYTRTTWAPRLWDEHAMKFSTSVGIGDPWVAPEWCYLWPCTLWVVEQTPILLGTSLQRHWFLVLVRGWLSLLLAGEEELKGVRLSHLVLLYLDGMWLFGCVVFVWVFLCFVVGFWFFVCWFGVVFVCLFQELSHSRRLHTKVVEFFLS